METLSRRKGLWNIFPIMIKLRNSEKFVGVGKNIRIILNFMMSLEKIRTT